MGLGPSWVLWRIEGIGSPFWIKPKALFGNCFLMFCRTNVSLGEMFLIIKK